MIIDFNKIEEIAINNLYGGENKTDAKMFADEKNKIMYGKLDAGASIGLHTHETSSEIIFILQGTCKILYDGDYEEVKQGFCHYCPKGHTHSIINDSVDTLIFFAVVPEQ